ncbi:MAG: DNRLRE domain-containing protein [Chitinophagales bacterium]
MAFIVFTPVQDAMISEYYPNVNYTDFSELFIGRFSGPGDSYRSLIQFNLASLGCNFIPLGSSINSAVLQVFAWKNQILTTATISVYGLLQSWDEKNVTWNTQPGNYHVSCNTALAAGFTGFFQVDITDLGKGWYNGNIVNNGLLIVGDESTNDLVGVYSHKWPYTQVWPRLIINYS